MNWYDFIKRYYGYGSYNDEDVATYVSLGKITEAEYEQITGETYTAA